MLIEPHGKKTCHGVSDQVCHIPGCTATQKMVKGLKFWIKEEEGWYYLCSENKSAGQLCSYHAADLSLF